MKDLLDDERIRISIISFLVGVFLAFVIYPKPEAETFYKFTTKTERDTIYVTSIDTIEVAKKNIKSTPLRDTILIEYKPQIKAFETSFPSKYGNTKVSGEVLGEVLKMTAINDFSVPVITKTVNVDKTETVVVKPKGIYLGVGVNSLLQPSAKVSYLDNKYLFSYQFEPLERVHQISVAKKLF